MQISDIWYDGKFTDKAEFFMFWFIFVGVFFSLLVLPTPAERAQAKAAQTAPSAQAVQ